MQRIPRSDREEECEVPSQRFDIVWDVVGKANPKSGNRILKQDGRYFNVDEASGKFATADMDSLKKLIEQT